MKNKKGFTLIELIAVIVIIGILVVLIIPSVSTYMVNTRNSTYKSHEKAMSEAAESYTIECINSNGEDCDIPLPNEEKDLYLNELEDKEYLSKLGDPAKNNSFCNPNTSYVKVYNTGDNDFEYLACLYCSSYATENPNCVTYTGDSDRPQCKIIETHSEWTNGSRQVKVGCQDATSGCIRNEFKKTFSTTTNKGIITITDKSGNSTDCEVEVKVDKNLPTCEITTTAEPINGWYPFGSKFNIVNMNDGESGLLTYGMGTSVEANFNKQREYVPVQGITRVFGYVKDNAGNVGTCSVNAKVKTKFIVHYDKNNGTGSMTAKSCMVDDDCYLDTNTFTRVGYTFDGWNTRANGSGTSYADGANVENIVFSGSITLYAKWKPHTLTIKFHGPRVASTDLKTSTSYTALQELDKSPYIFKYDLATDQGNKINASVDGLPNYLGSGSTWNLSSTGYTMDTNWIIGTSTSTDLVSANKKFDNAQALAADLGLSIDDEDQSIDLYANVSVHTYTITFAGNNNTGGSTANVSCTYDQNCTLTANGFTKKGHTFANWTNGTATYSDGASVKNLTATDGDTVTLTAAWSVNSYTCTAGNYLAADQISCSTCPANNYCPGGTYNYNPTTDQGKTACPTGYTNGTGQSAKNSCKISCDANKRVNTADAACSTDCGTGYSHAAHEVAAGSTSSACTANTYTLTYNNHSGSGCTSKTGTYGNKWGTLCTPSRSGYDFDGWYTAASGGSRITSNTTVSGNATAHAHWSRSCDGIDLNGHCYEYVGLTYGSKPSQQWDCYLNQTGTFETGHCTNKYTSYSGCVVHGGEMIGNKWYCYCYCY